MSLFKKMQSRQIQKKANSFIKSLDKKSEKEIEQAYLDNKEFENNEIVLSYLFFKHPTLIRILPVEFQESRINSNLNMFRFGSDEAKKLTVCSWLSENKFFMNANVIGLSDDEYNMYIKLYFQQPKDVAKLYMDDLKKTITELSNIDIKETESIVKDISDDLTDRQWEFIVEANPLFIKYAPQIVQTKFSNDEKYSLYLIGEARETFVEKQIAKVKEDISLLNSMPIDVQKEYICNYPYMINHLDDKTLIELLKYDIDLVKYANIPVLRNKKDSSQEIIFGVLENIETKTSREIINIFVNKGLFNAKGKLYRYDPKSNDMSYQYTKRSIRVIQKLDINQIMSLIMIDVNYVLPYITPVYNDDMDKSEKEKIIIDCNSRCLKLFEAYYGIEKYDKYYKVINKIFNEYLYKMDKYNYAKDYNCIFDLFKILFNKNIISKNNVEKITVFIGMSILYKGSTREGVKEAAVKLLNEILLVAYNKPINNNKELYDINSLEIYDDRLAFIDEEFLKDFASYNFVNMSSLLFIVKANKVNDYFKNYYEIIISLYGRSKESLCRAVENFQYYLSILKSVENVNLSDKELDNLVELLASFGNNCNITKKEQLMNYDNILLKKLIKELSAVKDEDVYRNLLCNYLFNRGYDQRGNVGLLETDTIKEICDVFDRETLLDFEVDGKKVFNEDEANLLAMTNLMFSVKDFDLLLLFIDNFISKKVNRDIVNILSFFNKIKKYRVELINSQIVTVNEIELLYSERPDLVRKENRNDVTVYSVINQDFKVLCSSSDDGIHYLCTNVSNLDKNYYGYNKLIKTGSIRFTTYENKTYVKINKENMNKNFMKPEFIITNGTISDELINIAKNNGLKIIEILES